MADLDTRLRGVIGAKTATALERDFGFETVRDLLAYYPRRLDDHGRLSSFAELELDEQVTVLAKVVDVETASYSPRGGRGRPGKRTTVTITDGQGRMTATFFNQPWLAGKLPTGAVALFSGKVTLFRGRRQLTHPMLDILGRSGDLDEHGQRVDVRQWWPIYRPSEKVTSKTLMESVELALDAVGDLADPLPDEVRDGLDLPPYAQAVRDVHSPVDRTAWLAARDRLKFDEAFTLQAVLARRRASARERPARARPARAGGLLDRFDRQLPFDLTEGQVDVGAELASDVADEHPMQRLLQGEVGSGKTVVALRAMLQVIDAGGQAALLAPTEVLAAQHYRTLVDLLGPLAEGGLLGGAEDGTRVALLTGSRTARGRREALSELQSGAAGIAVGTHALLEGHVGFADLGLVVVDEQHRFGVEQRAALTEKAVDGTSAHVLVMTATPIPRTVAMTAFGDLDTSTLSELPAGRADVQTTVVPAGEQPAWLDRGWDRIREEVAAGHQAYVVCPRIGDDDPEPDAGAPTSDEADGHPLTSVGELTDQLRGGPLRDLRVEMLHGRMGADEKDATMRGFAAGEVDVLVSTTVIEVGVDVPNASVMVVMDAERFGVSQLHQLRGRIGRGSVPGLCLLVTRRPEGSASRVRLDGVASTRDGFELARLDLETRREGDVLGAAQSGRATSLRLLNVLDDADVIESARVHAQRLVGADARLAAHPELLAEVVRLEASQQAAWLERS